MSPSEIVSRIPPGERTRLLIAFIAIDREDRGMAQDARQLMQLARYTDLRDSTVVQANGTVEQDQAAKPGAAPIRQSHRAMGSGGIHTLRGRDLAALQERARALVSKIDSHRSPSVGRPRANPATGEHILEVRYYGV
ncbi:hypothetical protein [Cupriavidus sp. BIC8F]|uniref:hypothetical protein n=1 Tax=Cupriavidus sp. BIC8F TaxID=3079014 RepID=UPI002915C972|nr:hypothetical protein [Cupriavidus sp. BIC8F]